MWKYPLQITRATSLLKAGGDSPPELLKDSTVSTLGCVKLRVLVPAELDTPYLGLDHVDPP